MSKLQKLIDTLCPDGVEYKTLQDVAEYRRGSFPQPYTNPQWYGGNNSMPFIQVADMHDDDFELAKETKQQISELAQPKSIFVESGTILVSIQGTIGRVAITQYDCYVDRTIAIFYNIKERNLDKKYFSYVLKQKFEIEKQHARGSTLKTITKEEFSKFKIPVPPLEIQDEIVKMLDKFAEFTAELTAELTARRKQYEYYKKQLLNIDTAEYLTLGEIANYRRGSFPQPYGNSQWYDGEDAMPFVQVADVAENGMCLNENTKRQISTMAQPLSVFVPKDTVIVSLQGSIGRVAITQYDSYVDRTLAIFESFKININKKYFAYQLEYKFAIEKEFARGSTIKTITKEEFTRFEIPIVPIEMQEEIVDILDRFDKLCNDISEGLPAEIEARQKQYEYYRDKLLYFKNKEEDGAC